MRTLSAAARRAVFAQETEQAFLKLLAIEHESLPEPIRVVNNKVNVTSRGQLYVAFPFEIDLPESDGDHLPQVTLSICNVDQTVVRAVRSLATPPQVSLEVILADSPDTVEAGPFRLTLHGVEYDRFVVTGTLVTSRSSTRRSRPTVYADEHAGDLRMSASNLPPGWTAAYVGRPYEDRGRGNPGYDCWGLVRTVLQERFGIEVPSYSGRYGSAREAEEIARLIRGEAENETWLPVEDERPGDVLVLRIGGREWHTAIVVAKGWMLHCLRGANTVLERYGTIKWKRRIGGKYRYRLWE
jgi:cell wall-associated NlpC family hydrolase